MGQYVNQAVEYIEKAVYEFGGYVDEVARHISEENRDKVNELYKFAASLQASVSQLSGEEKIVEGICQVDNVCAKVTVGNVDIRDKTQIAMQIDGDWCTGHRDNSTYGQVFVGKKGTKIIASGTDKARVTFPLKMDE